MSELNDAFLEGRRSTAMPIVVNDTVVVLAGPYAGREGAAVVLDWARPNDLRVLVEFGDGTDELAPVSNLKLVQAAS